MNETEADGTQHTWGYSYDANGRLTHTQLDGATEATYVYDANGNRLSRMTSADAGVYGIYDARDRIEVYGTMEYAFTPNGDLASKIDSASGALTSYNYDAMGNLRSVGFTNGGVIDYLVDGANRRIGKKINGVVTQQWVYQGQLSPVATCPLQGFPSARGSPKPPARPSRPSA